MMKKVSKMIAIALGIICSVGVFAVPTVANAAEIQRPTATGVRFDANGDGRVSVLDLIRAWKEYSYTRAENPEQAPTGFVYCTTDMLTSGKDTVQLSDIKNLRSKFIFNPTIASVQDMITALPEAETLISKNRVAVGEAKAAYDALSDSDKASVVNAGKLNACVAKVKIWDELSSKVVLDASYQVLGYANDSDNGKEAVLLTNVDDNTFEKVYSIKDATYVAVTKDLKTAKASFRESENIVLYIYNPTDSVVDGNYTMNWGYYGYFQLKPNSWNRIEIADFASDDVNKQMINSDATLYFYANMAGEGWKISSFYGLSADAADVAGETVVVDAAYQTLGVGNESGNGKTATFTPGVDDTDFGKIMSVKDATYIAVTNSVKTEQAAFKESDAIAFYIYNPTDSAVNGRFTMDWNNEFYFQLRPNAWNRIFFADFAGNDVNKQMIRSDATLYFYANMAGEGWKISSFYDLSLPGENLGAEVLDPEAEAIAAVIAQITALPEPNTLQLSDKEAVVTAESAYNTLSEAGKTKVENATKLSECLAKIAELESAMSQAVAPVEALINALPDPSTIVMPDNMKDLVAIEEAKKAYDALTSEQQGYVSISAVSKLNGCLTATQGYAIVFNAKTETALMYPHTGDQDCTGTVSEGNDVDAGPIFKLDITAKAASGGYGGGFYVYKEGSLTGVKNIVFMIYNPTGGNVNVEFYGDNWAKGFGTITLTSGWNRIDLLANAEINNGLYARIPMDQNAVGEWLISSIYSVTDEALAAEKVTRVELLLQGMPSADEITSLDDADKIESVQNARAAYDALGVNTSKVDASLVEKLVAAEAKITNLENVNQQIAAVEAMLEALTPADQITTLDSAIVQAVEDARAAYDALGDSQSQVNADLLQKLVDCEAKIAALNVKPEGYIAYTESPAPHFDYYSDEINAAYAGATLAPTTVAGETAQWSATVTITNQNGGYLRAYQGLNLTVEQLQEYQAQGYTHIRIPYYLEAPVDTAIYVHNNGWEWNYKEAATAVRNAWTNFDYPIEDLLMTYGGTATVLEGINTVKGAFGLMNINVTSSGDYKLYLGDAYMLKPAEESGVYVDYKSATTYFDYYSDATNAAYSNATLEDVEFEGQTAKWTATLNVTAQNGGYARVYEGLNLTVAELQAYKEQGYTHVRIPYYLEAPADTNIYVHNNGWEWNYKLSAAAVRNAWTNFDYPIDDLLMTYGGTATVLDGINSGARGAFGLINIQVNAVGTYKLYLGQAEMWKPEEVVVGYKSATTYFDYYSDATNAAYSNATLEDVEFEGQTAKWTATLNVTAQNGGYARVYEGLDITVAELQAYKEQGYTHVRIPYYLEAPADTNIYVHNNGWEWNYKLSAAAVRNAWTNFDYPIDDLLMTYGGTATVLEGINSGARGAFGLINIQVNAVGTYKLYLGEVVLR